MCGNSAHKRSAKDTTERVKCEKNIKRKAGNKHNVGNLLPNDLPYNCFLPVIFLCSIW